MHVAELANLSRADFVATLGAVFQGSPWVAEEVFAARPFADVEALHAAMVGTVAGSHVDRLLSLLRAHPEIASAAVRSGEIDDDSASAHALLGLDALDEGELARIEELNRRYRARFGFPFIIALRRHTRQSVMREMERRLQLPTTDEFTTAIDQVAAITRFRLEALFADGGIDA